MPTPGPVRPAGSGCWRTRGIRILRRGLRWAAGLPPIRLHDLRHTALTMMLGQGVPVHVVARFAGHDPSVTLRTYAHARDDAMRAAADGLGALFSERL